MLLDENLPRPLAKHFSQRFYVSTVSDEGWASKKNGELLFAMEKAGFEYLVTADRNLEHQQNLAKYPVKLVVLLTFDNRYKTLVRHVNIIEAAIEEADFRSNMIHIDLRKV
jgi:predicted nuclease of predicted toxin-antitoxin system